MNFVKVLVSFDSLDTEETKDVWLNIPEEMSHQFVDILSLGMLHAEFHGTVTAYTPSLRAEVAVVVIDGKIDYTNA
jgi:hypothetical protein